MPTYRAFPSALSRCNTSAVSVNTRSKSSANSMSWASRISTRSVRSRVNDASTLARIAAGVKSNSSRSIRPAFVQMETLSRHPPASTSPRIVSDVPLP